MANESKSIRKTDDSALAGIILTRAKLVIKISSLVFGILPRKLAVPYTWSIMRIAVSSSK